MGSLVAGQFRSNRLNSAGQISLRAPYSTLCQGRTHVGIAILGDLVLLVLLSQGLTGQLHHDELPWQP